MKNPAYEKRSPEEGKAILEEFCLPSSTKRILDLLEEFLKSQKIKNLIKKL